MITLSWLAETSAALMTSAEKEIHFEVQVYND